MHELGHTRTSYQRDHALLTPDSFVRAPRPGMLGVSAIVHVARESFVEYTAEFEAGGSVAASPLQRFVYVLDGVVEVEGAGRLERGGYAYLPAGEERRLQSQGPSRAAVIEKPYLPGGGGKAPGVILGDERQVAGHPLMDDTTLEVRQLLPADPAFDMAVNTMTFQPGAALPMVESHVMEHGLLMLDGGGIYRLGDRWYPVMAGDFIWMAPYCPQWFGALGKTPARYLIYKDWNR
jgi:(S)-ureidoglycine aminohydrolase